jgi:hypothetical protein
VISPYLSISQALGNISNILNAACFPTPCPLYFRKTKKSLIKTGLRLTLAEVDRLIPLPGFFSSGDARVEGPQREYDVM